MSADKLAVRHLDREVGTITRTTSGALSFEYAASWLSGGGFALATSLPLREGACETAFFRNLLPEAGAREHIARALGISPENDFAILGVLGADCAGALVITPHDSASPAGAAEVLPLRAEDGARLATRSGFASFFRPEHRVRLSLAGAQNKLAVLRSEEGLAVPLDGRPSTHILKLPSVDFKGLVENEALMLAVAADVGLPVVEHDIVTLGSTRALLVTRYDRAVSANAKGGGAGRRLHQQDLCQATGLPPDIKYEGEGGPSFKTVFDLVRAEVVDPLTATRSLLDWTVFNVLVHNADAHAKNISLLRNAAGHQVLAPFYDLICTGAYDLDHRMAMSVGGQFDPGAITLKSWLQLASEIGIGRTLLLKRIAEIGERIPAALDEEMAALRERLGTIPRRQQLERAVKRRVKKTLALIA